MVGYGVRLFLCAVLFAGMHISAVWAGTLQQAERLFAKGDFEEAADLAEAIADEASGRLAARAFALAARNNLTIYGLEPFIEDAKERLATAEAQARAAIAADPAHLEGYLQLALALGYRGRRIGPMAAHIKGLAVEARAAIEKGLQLAPNDPYALASIGAWHLEIVAGAGTSFAQLVYGAMLDEGKTAFERARAAAPKSPLFDVQYAAALLSINPRTYRDEALRALDAAVKKDPRDALERIYVTRAATLTAKLNSGDDSLLHDYLHCLQGIPEPEKPPESVPDLSVMRP